MNNFREYPFYLCSCAGGYSYWGFKQHGHLQQNWWSVTICSTLLFQ